MPGFPIKTLLFNFVSCFLSLLLNLSRNVTSVNCMRPSVDPRGTPFSAINRFGGTWQKIVGYQLPESAKNVSYSGMTRSKS